MSKYYLKVSKNVIVTIIEKKLNLHIYITINVFNFIYIYIYIMYLLVRL